MIDRPDTQEEQEERSELVEAMYAPQMKAIINRDIEAARDYILASLTCVLDGLEDNRAVGEVAEQSMRYWLDQNFPSLSYHVKYDPKTVTLNISYLVPFPLDKIELTIVGPE